MSTITERLKWLIEADASSAIKGFEATGVAAETSLKKAGTSSQKLGGQMTKIGAGATAFAAVAGVALFEVTKKWDEAALSAGKLATATGLTVEQASAWQVVAKGADVDTATLTTSLGKMDKAIEKTPEKFRALGAEIVKTKSGAIDTNATFLNVVEALQKAGGASNNANTAVAILGKGWQGMSELIGKSSDELKTRLAAVSSQQIFHEDDVSKAEQFRDSMKELGNAAQSLELSIGKGAAPALAGFAKLLSGAVKGVADLDSVTSGAAGSLLAGGVAAVGMIGGLTLLGGQLVKVAAKFGDMGTNAKIGMGIAGIAIAAYTINAQQAAQANANLEASIKDLSQVADADLIKTFVDTIVKGMFASKDLKQTTDELAKSNIEGAERVREMVQAHIDNGTATQNEKDAIGPLIQSIKDAKTAQEESTKATDEAKDSLDGVTDSTTNAQNTAAGYSYALQDVEASTKATKDATDEATKKSDAFAKSLQGQIDKLDELYPKQYDAVLAKYDFQKANEDALLAVDNLTTTLKDHKSTQEDVKTATDNAKDSIITQSEKFAALDGAAAGSEGSIRRQIQSLADTAATLAPGSPLRLYLDGYIADLASIQGKVDTEVLLHISSKYDAVNPNAPGYLPRYGGAGAGGGSLSAGVAYKVGEEGTEMFVPKTDGTLVPNGGTLGGITINNYRRDLTVGDLNQILAMARLSS